MEKKIYIILVKAGVGFPNRTSLEHIEGSHYDIEYNNDGYDKITAHKVYRHIQEFEFMGSNDFCVMELSEFTTQLNDEEIANLEDYFIGYVTASLIK